MAISTPTPVGEYLSTGNVTEGSATLTASAEVGDVLIVVAAAGSPSAVMSVSDSGGHAWSASPSEGTSTPAACTVRAFWVKVTSGLTTADFITVGRSPSGGLAWQVLRVTGASGTVYEQHAANDSSAGSTSNISTADISATPGSLTVLAVATRDNLTSFTAGAGFTYGGNNTATGGGNPRAYGWVYRASTTDETVTPAAAISPGAGWAAVSLGFSPEVQAPTGPYLIEWDGTNSTTLALIEWDGSNVTDLSLTNDAGGGGALLPFGLPQGI